MYLQEPPGTFHFTLGSEFMVLFHFRTFESMHSLRKKKLLEAEYLLLQLAKQV